MSAHYPRLPDARPVPIEFADFVSSECFTERRQPPAGASPTRRKPPAGARTAKYLLVAILGVLMATLIACGASTEPTNGESSTRAAPAPTDVSADAPTATKSSSTAPSATTDTTAPTTMSETTRTPTDVPAQAMPTDTPAPTSTGEPAAATAEPGVEILIPGITMGKSAWWWRSRGGDWTPDAVGRHHAELHQRLRTDQERYQQIAETLSEQGIAVLQAEGAPPAEIEDIKAFMTNRQPSMGFEIMNTEPPLVRYWTTLPGQAEHRIGAVMRYDATGEPPVFVEPSTAEQAPQQELDGVWWYRNSQGRGNPDYTAHGVLAAHPYGPFIDMLDELPTLEATNEYEGFLTQYAYVFQDELTKALAAAAAELMKSVAGKDYVSHYPSNRLKGELRSRISVGLSWEMTSPDSDLMRSWAEFQWPDADDKERVFRIGATISMTPVAAESWEHYATTTSHNIETLPVFGGLQGPATLEILAEPAW